MCHESDKMVKGQLVYFLTGYITTNPNTILDRPKSGIWTNVGLNVANLVVVRGKLH